MNGVRQVVLIASLLGWLSERGFAEQRGAKDPGQDFAAAADQVFGQFFGESNAERRALERVKISPREEQAIGERDLQGLLQSLRQRRIRVVERGTDADYLNALVAEIRPRMKNARRYPKIRVYVAETKETDARAFPGGSIVVMTGLIDFAESEAALVGVLAHELSHIDHGHQLRLARGMKLAQQPWTPQDQPAYGMPPNIALMTKQFARPFHAEDEAEADHDGAIWAFELSYDPLEMADLFRRLDRKQPTGPMRMPRFLRTHPYHAERYEAVKQLSSELRAATPGVKLYVGSANLRKRIPRSAAVLPESRK